MTEENKQRKRNRAEAEGKRGRDVGKETGRNAAASLRINPGSLLQACPHASCTNVEP